MCLIWLLIYLTNGPTIINGVNHASHQPISVSPATINLPLLSLEDYSRDAYFKLHELLG